ncbi:unnamed protein product [Eruca vesicaria subsp. sativa]|uniref:Uncharacterized protein n=1 Tax=Eruca vesicaria subsp. sativa TaxID=29727 RepID=A0ABC8IVR0_ERUVS|nr:unnamed protein product [Eruca vesicaria subsp. sativa]
MGDTDATKFFICSNYFSEDDSCTCLDEYSNFSTSRCRCGSTMSTMVSVSEEDQVGEEIGNSADGVFVKCRSSFIVTDDLKVSVNSIGVIMNVLNDLGYLGFSDLQESLLDVGLEEVLTLLGCFFTSETPLTCAFLKKHCMTRNLKMLSAHVQNTVEPCSVFSVKVFVRKFDKEILYAECNADFIDYLLGFLISPLELKMQTNISDLEEHQISISGAELISILRASLVSSSALTNGLSNLLMKKPKEET